MTNAPHSGHTPIPTPIPPPTRAPIHDLARDPAPTVPPLDPTGTRHATLPRAHHTPHAPHAPRVVRVALAHDWLTGLRGGERVLDALIRACHTPADDGFTLVPVAIYTMFADGRALTPAIDALPRVVSPLGRLPGAHALRRWLLPLYPLAVASLSRTLAHAHAREPIDLLVSTSSAAIKAIRAPHHAPARTPHHAPHRVPHICYVHAPARYIWSRTDDYATASPLGLIRGLALRAARAPLRRWDRATASTSHGPDVLLANSEHTRAQILACWARPSIVLHPPVDTDAFTPAPRDPRGARAAWWLAAGALEPYKRVDVAIRAAILAGAHLKIIGDGTQRPILEALARDLLAQHARDASPHTTRRDQRTPTIEFLGRVPHEQLLSHLRQARVLVFPQVEDFGIIAAEALACGTPVAARDAGGARDIVADGVTGALFPDATVGTRDQRTQALAAGLAAAVARAPHPDAPALRARALDFADHAFVARARAAMIHALHATSGPSDT
jgi:glycosyltransferase involved in cell wall biosynthesis